MAATPLTVPAMVFLVTAMRARVNVHRSPMTPEELGWVVPAVVPDPGT